jgi:DNA polymerase V
MTSPIAAGFPSPAEDYREPPLDFNELLIEQPAATFAVRISGDSMVGVGLFAGDIAIVNRALSPMSGAIIIALVQGEFTIKRYTTSRGQIILRAENPDFAPLLITPDMSFEVWGVVTHAIRMLHPQAKHRWR